MAGWIARDTEVLEIFYRDHAEAVQRSIAGRIASPDTAADLTVDVFWQRCGRPCHTHLSEERRGPS
jgi:hypothetical protein